VTKHLRSIIGIIISVGLLWWVLREVSPSVVLHELSRSNPWLLALAVVCATLIFPLRARRWQTILDPVYPKLPLGALWRSTAIGMALNNVIPLRAGEVARAYTLTRQTHVPFSASIASLAIDRVFDSIVLFAMGFAAILSPNFPAGYTIQGVSLERVAIVGSIGVALIIFVLYTLVYFPQSFIHIFEIGIRRLSPKLEERGKAALLNFSEGLSVLRHPRHVIAIFWWSVAHWLLNALAFWIAMWAVGIHAPFSAAVLLQTIIALGVAVPAAPGFFGVFEKAAILGLAIYAVPKELATTWAIGFHILSFLPITIIGLTYFSRMNLKLGEIRATA
jgi:uncharacterized protein (TIRG00374 family)